MKSMLMKFGMVAVLASSALGLTGCSDEELALGAGVIIGAVIADDDNDHHHHRPPPPRCGYRCRGGGHHYPGHRPGHRWAANVELAIRVPTDVAKASSHFSVHTAAARKIMNALRSAEQKDFSPLADLGLEREDLEKMARNENPSASALISLSEKLDLDFGDTHNVIQVMKTDLEEGL